MTYRVEFAPQAIADAIAASVWLAEHQTPEWADRWCQGLFDKAATLKTLPRRCPKIPERTTAGGEVRHLLYGKRPNTWRIVFRVQGDVVRVIAVLHASRGPLQL